MVRCTAAEACAPDEAEARWLRLHLSERERFAAASAAACSSKLFSKCSWRAALITAIQLHAIVKLWKCAIVKLWRNYKKDPHFALAGKTASIFKITHCYKKWIPQSCCARIILLSMRELLVIYGIFKISRSQTINFKICTHFHKKCLGKVFIFTWGELWRNEKYIRNQITEI